MAQPASSVRAYRPYPLLPGGKSRALNYFRRSGGRSRRCTVARLVGATPGAVLHWKVASPRSRYVRGFSACVQPLLHPARAVGLIEVRPINLKRRLDVPVPQYLGKCQEILGVILQPFQSEVGIFAAFIGPVD